MNESMDVLGYCTNVHAGTSLDSILSNLRTHALRVRQELGAERLGIGLWFSESAAIEALEPANTERLRSELSEMGLVPYTVNGFPQGDFHSAVVKQRVYHPTWWQPERAAYTRNLVELLGRLLEPGRTGSISTLPIAWGNPNPTPEQWQTAAQQLIALAENLHQRFETTGQRIVLALEPEPGCALTHTASLRQFFAEFLSPPALSHAMSERVRAHITLCHDICHAAVMCEDQASELAKCRQLGLRIGKVQISSAISVPWDTLDHDQRAQAVEQLTEFAEDRYLHQTMIRDPDGTLALHEDLPNILNQPSLRRGEWRIHFHVPIYVEAWGCIRSTHREIDTFLQLLGDDPERCMQPAHLEVETYAWGVLPPAMRVDALHLGIARELQWLQHRIAAHQ